MIPVVVDTNVPIVANRKHMEASPACVKACIGALRGLRNKIVLLDNQQLILGQYRRHLAHSGEPGVGDRFFKWLWDNQGNTKRCMKVVVSPTSPPGSGFAEFPSDSALATFDPDDKVFVAVACGSGLHPEIWNASDSDWWNFRIAFANNEVTIKYLCPELMDSNI